jgi:hypothetical protein
MINQILAGRTDSPVEVGSPATILYVSDRYPAIVTEVTNFKTGAKAGTPKQVTVVRVEYTAEPFPSGYGEAHLDRPIAGTEHSFTLRKDGRWKDEGGTTLKIGAASYYNDPSF